MEAKIKAADQSPPRGTILKEGASCPLNLLPGSGGCGLIPHLGPNGIEVGRATLDREISEKVEFKKKRKEYGRVTRRFPVAR